MSSYAFIDEDRKQQVSAIEALEYPKGQLFYCPEPDCPGIMTLRHGSAYSPDKPYFAALPSSPHRKNPKCPYSSGTTSYNNESFDQSSFSPDSLLASFQTMKNHSNQKGSPNRPIPKRSDQENIVRFSSVRQLYYFCKQHHPQDTYNNLNIGYVLFDSRSSFMYPNGIYQSTLIVEAMFCDNNDSFIWEKLKEIWLLAPTETKACLFRLQFSDEKTFNRVKNQINSLGSYSLYAILGKVVPIKPHKSRETKSNMKTYTIRIVSGRQIYPVK